MNCRRATKSRVVGILSKPLRASGQGGGDPLPPAAIIDIQPAQKGRQVAQPGPLLALGMLAEIRVGGGPTSACLLNLPIRFGLRRPRRVLRRQRIGENPPRAHQPQILDPHHGS